MRPGADYGVDYVLYATHPSVAHSSYCVLGLTGSKRPEALRWTDIEAASRVCSEVPEPLKKLYTMMHVLHHYTHPRQPFPAVK